MSFTPAGAPLSVPGLAATLAGSLILLALGHYRQRETQISSDGDRYLRLGAGIAVPYPFMFRWLVPRLCATSVRRWRVCTDLHLLALPVLTTGYVQQAGVRGASAVVGGLLICGFAGIWRNHLRRPVLVDPPALTWALAAAVLAQSGCLPGAILAALLAACMKETAPVFAACFALSPVLLLALLAPLARRLVAAGGEDTHHSRAVSDPIGWSREQHAERVFDPVLMLLPWGVGLLALRATDGRVVTVLVLALVAGYGQLITAGNTVRLYQWAGPAVALAAAGVLPSGWQAVALAVHLFNPWAGEGR